MDIDKHDIQILATKISKILIESSSTLLRTYPRASFALVSLLFSYIFFPAILWFLISTMPFVVLIGAITIKTYTNVNKGRATENHENAKYGKSPRKVESVEDDNKKYNAKHARSVRRRKSMIIFTESTQDGIQEKEAISSTNFVYDLVDKRPMIEETPKEIREVEVNVVSDRIGSSPSDVCQDFRSQFKSILRSQTFGGSATEMERISLVDTKDEDEDPRGEDQKNLADLCLSEIERNKRLEILMARRRERKIPSLQARKTMMNMGGNASPRQMMHSIAIPTTNPLSPRSYHSTPASAPLESLSVRNPFDLPYEPQEEKPNLTEDSFHQEFLGTHPKDVLFCRRKSFSSWHILAKDMSHNLHQTSMHNNYGTKQEVSELQEVTECLLGEKEDEKAVEQEQTQEAECDDEVENTDKNIPDQGFEQGSDVDDVSHEDIQNEVNTKSVIVEDYSGRVSFSSYSSEENEPIDRLDREKLLESLCSLDSRNMTIQKGGSPIDDILFDHGSSGTYKNKGTGPFSYPYHNMHNASSFSLASDLQVEVSELSSPRRLSDGNISSPDEVISLCDSEIPVSEDMLITSPQLSRTDEYESRSRDLGQESEEDITAAEFSRIQECFIPEERVITQDSSDPHPNFVSESKVPGDDAYKDHIERIVHEQPSTSWANSSHDLNPENVQLHEDKQSTGTSMTDHFHNTDLQNPKVPSLPTSNPTEKLDISISSPTLQVHDEHISQNVDDKAPFPHNTVNNIFPGGLQDSASGFESQEYLKPTIVNGSTGESSQPIFTIEIEGMPEEVLQHTEIRDSRSTEGNYMLESTDTEDEASSAIATSEPSQFVIQPNGVAPVPESQTEQVPAALSTSSSPKSVLNPMFSANQGSLSQLSDIVQLENQLSGGESSSSNFISALAQIAAPLADNLTTYESHETTESEPSNSQLESTEEATSTLGSLSNHEMDSGSTDHGQKVTSETSFVYNNTTNQETSLDTISSNEEETA